MKAEIDNDLVEELEQFIAEAEKQGFPYPLFEEDFFAAFPIYDEEIVKLALAETSFIDHWLLTDTEDERPQDSEKKYPNLNDFRVWMEDFLKSGKFAGEDQVLVKEGYPFLTGDDQEIYGTIRFYFVTATNDYSITASCKDKHDKGYLGCIAGCRIAEPGKAYLKGTDLHDGPLTRETLNNIFMDILSNEFLHLYGE